MQGNGWGHSLGMSQYGAEGAARLGCTHAQILATYYQGTHLVRSTMTAPVQLSLLKGASDTQVTAEDGTVTWSAPGATSVVQPRGQTWRVKGQTRNNVLGAAVLDTTGTVRVWAASPGWLSAQHVGVTVRLRSSSPALDLRVRWGVARFQRSQAGEAVQEVISTDSHGNSVTKYLWGLAEVPVSWPSEALRAQADAARTYLSSVSGSHPSAYSIGTTTAAQVYGGATREDQDAAWTRAHGGGWKAAVNATDSEVVVDSAGRVISAMYASSDGGHSESRAYVYGAQGGYGYLTGVDDSRWDLASDNPNRSWAVTFTPSEFARRLGFTSVSAVSIGAPGSAARNAGLKVTGVQGGTTRTEYFTGSQVRYLLNLRSAGIAVSWPQASTQAVAGTLGPNVQALSGDWDGDGTTDVGWYDRGTAIVTLRLGNGQTVRYRYGFAGATAVVGDWNGDGKDSIGLFAGNRWYLRNTLTGGAADVTFTFGRAGTGRWPDPGTVPPRASGWCGATGGTCGRRRAAVGRRSASASGAAPTPRWPGTGTAPAPTPWACGGRGASTSLPRWWPAVPRR